MALSRQETEKECGRLAIMYECPAQDFPGCRSCRLPHDELPVISTPPVFSGDYRMSKSTREQTQWWKHYPDGSYRIHGKDFCNFFQKPQFTADKRPLDPEHYYNDEFQQWFISGLRLCGKHPYPVRWHVMQSIDCPKCRDERHSLRR